MGLIIGKIGNWILNTAKNDMKNTMENSERAARAWNQVSRRSNSVNFAKAVDEAIIKNKANQSKK